jgi:hypothetical protein
MSQCGIPLRKHRFVCVQEFAPLLRVLGTYPMDTELGFTSCDDPLAVSSPPAALSEGM